MTQIYLSASSLVLFSAYLLQLVCLFPLFCLYLLIVLSWYSWDYFWWVSLLECLLFPGRLSNCNFDPELLQFEFQLEFSDMNIKIYCCVYHSMDWSYSIMLVIVSSYPVFTTLPNSINRSCNAWWFDKRASGNTYRDWACYRLHFCDCNILSPLDICLYQESQNAVKYPHILRVLCKSFRQRCCTYWRFGFV